MSVSSGSQLSTPVKQAKQGVTSSKSLPPLASDCKKLLLEQHQRLWLKHQQDLDLIDDIKSYVKSRLSIERDYCSALQKLAKQHSTIVAKKFTNIDAETSSQQLVNISHNAENSANILDANNNNNLVNSFNSNQGSSNTNINNNNINNTSNRKQLVNTTGNNISDSEAADDRLQKRLATNGIQEPEPCTLYKVWCEHIIKLMSTSKYKSEQYESLLIVVERLKDIRQHKSNIGKKCLDNYLKRIHEDLVAGLVEIEKSRKLYYEDESQAKKARENEERIKKKKIGLLTKFTDLQLKKEKTTAQREANDIQSTQARNDYIMALAAGNAHLEHYYQQDLPDIMQTIDDGVLDQCKYFMATLSECDMNSLKDSLSGAQYWSKMISLSGSHVTNSIFLKSKQSACLQENPKIPYEPCNNDPICNISLEHNADYALQHEIDKWFTWFKKECRNLSHLIHQLETCQRAVAEGKRSIEINGQTIDDLESKIIDLKQQIRKSEAAKLKAQARLKVIKEGGMQIDEWSTVESEIKADMARIQESINSRRRGSANPLEQEQDVNLEFKQSKNSANQKRTKFNNQTTDYINDESTSHGRLSSSRGDSEDNHSKEDTQKSQIVQTSTSRPNTNVVVQSQQSNRSTSKTDYAALADPDLAWSDSYDANYAATQWPNQKHNENDIPDDDRFGGNHTRDDDVVNNKYQFLGTAAASQHYPNQNNSMTVQSSSPLSAIVDGVQTSASPYQQSINDAYKSDYECDYNRSGNVAHADQNSSTSGSADPHQHQQLLNKNNEWSGSSHNGGDVDEFGGSQHEGDITPTPVDATQLLGKHVVTLYPFEEASDGDLKFDENEVLLVLEINDANWVKARNLRTGEEGFVPVSYVQIQDIKSNVAESLRVASASSNDSGTIQRSNHNKLTYNDSDVSAWDTQDLQQQSNVFDDSTIYGRALYDYSPEEGAQEDDGLPHLSLAQGDILRIIDQTSDDGWWTVEREKDGVRGHVPSMLVEEMCEGEEDDDEELENEAEGSDNDEYGSISAMPTFAAPKLITDEDCSKDTTSTPPAHDLNDEKIKPPPDYSPPKTCGLAPTAFVIIQPTPEIESRRITDDPATIVQTAAPTDQNDSKSCTDDGTPSVYPSSYSVVNESFVLEGPTRRPHHIPEELTPHHDTPTILEEPYDNANDQNETRLQDDDIKAANYEPLSEVDSLPEMPAPPSLVVDSFEDGLTYDNEEDLPAPNFEDPIDNNTDIKSSAQTSTSTAPQISNPIPSTACKTTTEQGGKMSQILIDRANSFSEQITREAIQLATSGKKDFD